MSVGVLTLHLHLPGCTSLKEKRSRLRPLLARLHREFNVSVAEMERNDSWQEAIIACALISNEHGQTQRALQHVLEWIDHSWNDVYVSSEEMEIF